MDPRLNSLTTGKLLHSFADFLMPRVCIVCGRQLLYEERHLCLECMAGLPLTYFEGLRRNPMGDKITALLPEVLDYVQSAALFHYSEDSGYGMITRALKYGRDFGAGRFFAAMLGERLAVSGLWSDVDVVCPVPLHPLRRWRRGYNQAEVIGREVAQALGARFVPGLLRRVRRTASQTHLSGAARSANVEGAFALGRGALPFGSDDGGRQEDALKVLIVDDVCTTGATLASCVSALYDAFGGRVRVFAATLAFVED